MEKTTPERGPIPDSPTTDHALPPAGETAGSGTPGRRTNPRARTEPLSGPRAVPGPAQKGSTKADLPTARSAASPDDDARDLPTARSAASPSGAAPPRTRVPARHVRPPRGRPPVVRSSDPGELRREIERTRARMSDTLDAVEYRIAEERESLERKKDELVDIATLKGVRQKLKREPWRSMAIAFAAGYIIAAIRD